MATVTEKLAEAKRLEALAAAYDLGRPGWWRGSVEELADLNFRARELRAEAVAEIAARPLVWADDQ